MSMFRNILVSAGVVLAFLPPANAQGTAPGPKPTAAEIKQAVALALTPGIQARPAICLKEYVDWCKTTTPKKWCYLTYTLSQIDSTGRVDYSEGFLSYNVVGGVAWVLGFVMAGFWFGNIPVVKRNFTLVIFAIIIISVMPAVIEVIRQRARARAAH